MKELLVLWVKPSTSDQPKCEDFVVVAFLSRGPETPTSWSLTRGGHLLESLEFLWLREATTRNTFALAGYKANLVEKLGGFRIGSHLYKAVTYNFVIHIFIGSPYFQIN